MNWAIHCVAVIPCFNEARHIADVVRGVSAHLPNIIVVDDGSTDATADIARQAGAKVLRHETNLGKGAALRAGFDHAHKLGFTWALMLAPWLRRFVNRWMSRRLSHLTGMPLTDSQCGFRLVNLDAYLRVALRKNHFEIESEMLVTFVTARCGVKFVPVRTIYKAEASKIHPILDAWRWFSWWWKLSRCNKSARVERSAVLECGGGAQRRHRFLTADALPKWRGASLPVAVQNDIHLYGSVFPEPTPAHTE